MKQGMGMEEMMQDLDKEPKGLEIEVEIGQAKPEMEISPEGKKKLEAIAQQLKMIGEEEGCDPVDYLEQIMERKPEMDESKSMEDSDKEKKKGLMIAMLQKKAMKSESDKEGY